jgi:hypothetical protein
MAVVEADLSIDATRTTGFALLHISRAWKSICRPPVGRGAHVCQPSPSHRGSMEAQLVPSRKGARESQHPHRLELWRRRKQASREIYGRAAGAPTETVLCIAVST